MYIAEVTSLTFIIIKITILPQKIKVYVYTTHTYILQLVIIFFYLSQYFSISLQSLFHADVHVFRDSK